jgi:hypothetical protein
MQAPGLFGEEEASGVSERRPHAIPALLALFLAAIPAAGQDQPAPAATPPTLSVPTGLVVKDTPNDAGNSISVGWAEGVPPGVVYVVERRREGTGDWTKAGEARPGALAFTDAPIEKGEPVLENDVRYEYRVTATAGGKLTPEAPSAVAGAAAASPSYFHRGRRNILGFFVFFLAAILVFIDLVRRGKGLYIRPIAGLKALEEAVGRATEMGKPVFFMPGIDEANNIQTLYGMVILQHVTRLVARYETPLIVVVGKAFVMPLAQETVRQGYLDAGRPELYNPNIVRYYSDEQFATVTAVAGIFLREKPATNLYFGSFYAESLILAETGFLAGSIQIAGTGNIHQLPFFVVACDYALVGEEFFTVSAYLSKDPKLVGSVKAMDFAKAAILAVLAIGCVAYTVEPQWGAAVAAWFRVL